ncbi:MAG: hypothetical protein LBB68_03090 [Treponema sp.]|jgi:hypothetical protein|nr:hypothetical protein [Treponema sp.]
MALLLGKKWFCLILMAYFVLAVIEIFTFAVIGPLQSDDFWKAKMGGAGGFFTLIDHTTDCLSENAIIQGKANGHSFSSLHNSSLRITISPGAKDARTVFSQSFLRVIEKAKYLNIKNTILLKL